MSDLIVVTFPAEDEARAALEELRQLERAGQIAFVDTAVVTRRADGQTEVKGEASSTTETGAVVGAVIGPLVTIFFPVVGIVAGAAVGAAVGAAMASGISGSFVKEVQAKLEPGSSALFLLVKQSNPEAIRGAFANHPGHVLQTNLDSDAEESLRAALHDTSPTSGT